MSDRTRHMAAVLKESPIGAFNSPETDICNCENPDSECSTIIQSFRQASKRHLRKVFAVAGIIALHVIFLAQPASATLVHRWSFSNDASDSVGSANATLFGDAAIQGGELVLDGSGDWATLPIDATLSGLGSSTFEAWATYDTLSAWARIFDFGNNDRSSYSEPGGGYMYLTGSPEYSYNNPISYAQFYMTDTSTVNSSRNDVVIAGDTDNPPLELYYAVTIDADADLVSLYINGSLLGSQSYTFTPGDIVNNDSYEYNWLGKSRWGQDSYMDGSISEFRIYDTALSADQVAANSLLGPDSIAAPVPEPSSALLLAFGLLGACFASRRKRWG